MLHASVQVAFLLGLLDLLTLVILPFAAGQCDLDLRQAPVVKVYPQRHQSKAPLFELDRDLGDLRLVQEQLAVPHRLVIIAGCLGVRGDLTADQPALAPDNTGIRAVQVASAVAVWDSF